SGNQKNQQRADSIGVLVIDLSRLGGMERALADLIDFLTTSGSARLAGSQEKVDALNSQLEAIKSQFARIEKDIASIDPSWAMKHQIMSLDLGNFAHDGAMYYCIQSCPNSSYRSGAQSVQLSDPQDAKKLSDTLRSDEESIRKLMQRLEDLVKSL